MLARNRVAAFASFVFTSLIFSHTASANWTGYINDKSLNGQRYGYLLGISSTRPLSKLRILCQSDDRFTLYIDEKIIDESTAKVDVMVDQLPRVHLVVSANDGRVTFSDKYVDFWMLIAQMSAGVTLSIDAGAGGLHRYSLEGFTHSYLSQCGWSGGARNYQNYLHHYR